MDSETAIFCSDGLPPLPKPTANVRNKKDSAIETSNIDTIAAFEVFNNRVFPNRQDDQQTQTSSSTVNSVSEAPMQRLVRLKREVAELEMDLNKNNVKVSGSESNAKANNAEMMRLARSLANRLDTFSTSGDGPASANVLSTQQQRDLTLILQNSLKELQNRSDASLSSSSSLPGGGAVSDGSPASVNLTGLEARLAQIERAVGSTDIATNNLSLAERLAKAEKMIDRVDTKALDAAAARARIIKSDLEAASKAKAKISASSSSEDTKTIAKLYEQMIRLDDLSAQLPVLVQRMKQLSTLHQQAATFANRLTAVEDAVADAERMLGSVEASLEKVEAGSVKNLQVIESNISILDERLNKLE
mmetsp:Transcript_20070/g.30766  ORF Transcript_20070/g.30766 Transcript_20070/m.30766 type:complete len:361 (+) Transcript_20070:70-1152(+)|eukprot:CAMPEP_0196824436 /NCGR_PEP_ID=MMETSP1362-20130617/91833_1 /TAXON_ID=163516 /ORGANISM="Leptocylindrus danicus, Strain CCMP1856" /LENGTH=360 /DNA_ID=CAMNT_0042204695 /DNA_START=109 /DNA_END=1191 /DNA_ORIENTATION=+